MAPIELELPELDGLTAKMYRGGKICLDIHAKIVSPTPRYIKRKTIAKLRRAREKSAIFPNKFKTGIFRGGSNERNGSFFNGS